MGDTEKTVFEKNTDAIDRAEKAGKVGGGERGADVNKGKIVSEGSKTKNLDNASEGNAQ